MRTLGVCFLGLLILLPACSSTSAGSCSEPPASELGTESDFVVRLEPNPVEAGTIADLIVEFEAERPDRPIDYLGGVGVSWQCWDGSEWVETHRLTRAFDDVTGPGVIDLSTDTEFAIPDLGLRVPNSHEVLIPEVVPGTYRITDIILGPDSTLTSHLLVEVE